MKTQTNVEMWKCENVKMKHPGLIKPTGSAVISKFQPFSHFPISTFPHLSI